MRVRTNNLFYLFQYFGFDVDISHIVGINQQTCLFQYPKHIDSASEGCKHRKIVVLTRKWIFTGNMATTIWAKYHGIPTKLAAVWGTDALSGHEGAADSANSLMDRYLCMQRSLHVTSLDDFLRQFDGFGYLKTATSSTWIFHYKASSYWDPHLCTPLEPP